MRWSLIFVPMLLTGSAVAADHAPLPAFMTGAWQMGEGDRWGDEYWTPPRGGMMIGAARIGRGDAVKSWESTRIGYDEAGKLAFWAMPNWAPATKFTATEQTPTSITFVNAGHDYPQRVRYWREGALLKAEISLADGSKAIRFDYRPMGR